MRILFVMLEFSNWQQARSWSYCSNFALAEALRTAGHDVTVVPAIANFDPTSHLSWLSHAPKILTAERYDQAWVSLVHNRFDEPFWEWLEGVAPVRLALVAEALTYSTEDCEAIPGLRERAALVEPQLKHFTHLTNPDELECDALTSKGYRTFLLRGSVPAALIAREPARWRDPRAASSGTVYGKRAAFLTDSRLTGKLVKPPSPEDRSGLDKRFDAANLAALQSLHATVERGARPTAAQIAEHARQLSQVRRQIFAAWVTFLGDWFALVALPSFLRAYPGHVYEGMAAGRPVIAWRVPDRPRLAALFNEGQEILLFDPNAPGELARCIERLREDPGLADYLANNALTKLQAGFTTERLVESILEWIGSPGGGD